MSTLTRALAAIAAAPLLALTLAAPATASPSLLENDQPLVPTAGMGGLGGGLTRALPFDNLANPRSGAAPAGQTADGLLSALEADAASDR